MTQLPAYVNFIFQPQNCMYVEGELMCPCDRYYRGSVKVGYLSDSGEVLYGRKLTAYEKYTYDRYMDSQSLQIKDMFEIPETGFEWLKEYEQTVSPISEYLEPDDKYEDQV